MGCACDTKIREEHIIIAEEQNLGFWNCISSQIDLVLKGYSTDN